MTISKLDSKSLSLGLSFDDVLIVPAYSEVIPSEVSLQTSIAKDFFLDLPILSAAMDTVSERDMGIVMSKAGGMAVIHKNLSIQEQAAEVAAVKAAGGRVGAAIGTAADAIERGDALISAGADAIFVDTAHGHSKNVGNVVKNLRAKYPDLIIVAGNIATADGALFLKDMGASAVKVGIGPGSICTTRVVSGCGYPQLSAIHDVARALDGLIPVIADGGIRESGDMVKALAAGASAVMIGSMLAGTAETPGEIFKVGDVKYKNYRGMGSIAAMKKGSADRYAQQNVEHKKLVAEGIEAFVKYKGEASDLLEKMRGGIQSGMGYAGAKTIGELWEKARFVQITSAGIAESHPHSVIQMKD